MIRKNKQGSRTDYRVRDKITQFLASHPEASAADVARHLDLVFTDEKRRESGITLPTIRTVQNLVRQLRIEDQSGEWSVVDAEPEQAALVIPVLAYWNYYSKGRIQRFTNAQARWIERLLRIDPELPFFHAHIFAEMYRRHESRNEGTAELDLVLGYAGWRSKERMERFYKADAAGCLPEGPWEGNFYMLAHRGSPSLVTDEFWDVAEEDAELFEEQFPTVADLGASPSSES